MRFFSKKHFIFGILIGLVLLAAYLFSLPDGRLHLTFCNIGQGDAAYIRMPNNLDMLIDGGPDDKVLSCLGRHMPFYDRTIDVVVLSHPQSDHLTGLISVLARYQVKNFVIGVVGNDSKTYGQLIDEVKKRNISVKHLYSGDQFSAGGVKVSVLWPEKEWVAENLSPSLSDFKTPRGWPEGLPWGGEISSAVLGLSTSSRDLNDFSFYLQLSYGTFDALFTGDGDSRIQPEIMKTVELPQVEVLKFPHHGSKYGALPEFLDKVKPELAVISAGKNPWGHPTQETIKLLNEKNIAIKRTDREGDIEVTSNGKTWWVK